MKRATASVVLLLAVAASAQDATPPAPRPEASSPAPGIAADAAEKRDRRERLARLAGADAAVLVLAADDSPGFTGSTQSRDYSYLSPFDARGAAVLVMLEPGEAGAAPVLSDRLYLRVRSPAAEIWSGPVAGPGDETCQAGLFDATSAVENLAADIALSLKSRRTLFVSAGGPADGSKLLGPIVASLRARMPGTWVRLVDAPGGGPDDLAESVRRALPEKLPRDRGPAELVAALPAVDVRSAGRLTSELREVKSPSEIARIRVATESTALGMADALRAAGPGMLEMHVAAFVELRNRLAGCARQAYPSIVGSGTRSRPCQG